ncbi:MAG TPA: hypothetical protein VIS74_02395 [Chthoniobacterales bacterium]
MTTLRRIFLPAAFFALLAGANGRAGSAYDPEIYSADRYEQIWTRRPFSPATPDGTGPSQGIEQQYALAGLIKMADQWVAFVLDRKTLERQAVSATANEANMQLVSVQEQADPRNSTIVLKAGSQSGTLRFDPALLSSTNAPVPANPEGSPKPSAAVTAEPAPASGPPSPTRVIRRTLVHLIK